MISENNPKSLLILYFISIWTSFIQTQFYKLEYDPFNRTTSCYLAKGPFPMAVKVTYSLPKRVVYFQMAAEFNITLDDEDETFHSVRSTYDLVADDKDCENSFFVSSKGLTFKTATLKVEFFTARGWGVFATSIHKFSRDLDKDLKRLWDIDNWTAFSVDLRKTGDDFLPKSSDGDMHDIVTSLNRVPSENDCLCVLAQNKQYFILKPLKYSPSWPYRHIAGLHYRYWRHDLHPMWQNGILTAFGCGCAAAKIEEKVNIIYEHNTHFNGNIEVVFIDAASPHHCHHEKTITSIELFVPKEIGVHTKQLHKIRSDTKKIYLINTTKRKIYCTEIHIRYIHRSHNGIELYGYDFKEETFGKTTAVYLIPADPIWCPRIAM